LTQRTSLVAASGADEFRGLIRRFR